MLLGTVLSYLCFPGLSASAEVLPRQSRAFAENVIVVMFDGVRWQEFFGESPDNTTTSVDGPSKEQGRAFPKFWSELASQGVVYGGPGADSQMTVSNPYNTSLTAYESIFAGKFLPSCTTNSCGPTKVETVQERLVRELGMPKEKVATISSWVKMRDAVEHVPGSTYVNVAFEEFSHDRSLSNKAKADPPEWPRARKDEHTWSAALEYLKTQKPRFLYISFDDADEYGHLCKYGGYISALHRYDAWLSELVNTFEAMDFYRGKTTLIVTTDHGRGGTGGVGWCSHGPDVPDSSRIWLYVRGPHVKLTGHKGILQHTPKHQHIDIRPTIETLFGLEPVACKECGSPLPEAIGDGLAPAPCD